MDTLIASSADLAGDQNVISRAEAVRPAVAAASGEIENTATLPETWLATIRNRPSCETERWQGLAPPEATWLANRMMPVSSMV